MAKSMSTRQGDCWPNRNAEKVNKLENIGSCIDMQTHMAVAAHGRSSMRH